MGRRRQPFQHLAWLPLSAIASPPGDPPAEEAVERVAAQMRRQGQREPVLVTPMPGTGEAEGAPAYRLVAGHRRLAAAQRLGRSEVDAVVLGDDFAAELAVIERLQAGPVPPMELAATLQRLQQRCAWTQAQLGAVLGRNRDFVAGLLALNDIRPEVQAWLATHADRRPLSARHLRYIGRATPRRQMAVAVEIVAQGLSAKALEQRFRQAPRRRQYIKVRALRQPERGPETTLDWRRYYRKLRTDLRRVSEQEAQELRRTDEQIEQARQRQRLIRQEARAKRQALDRELRRTLRRLSRSEGL